MSHALATQYIKAINNEQADAFATLFAADATVEDNGRTFTGIDAIRHWAEQEIFAVHVRLQPVNTSARDGETIVVSLVEGDFDKTGLPDPLYINQAITESNGKITRLACTLATDTPAPV